MSVKEAAQMLNCSTRTIERYLATRKLHATQATTGGKRLFRRSEVERLLKRPA